MWQPVLDLKEWGRTADRQWWYVESCGRYVDWRLAEAARPAPFGSERRRDRLAGDVAVLDRTSRADAADVAGKLCDFLAECNGWAVNGSPGIHSFFYRLDSVSNPVRPQWLNLASWCRKIVSLEWNSKLLMTMSQRSLGQLPDSSSFQAAVGDRSSGGRCPGCCCYYLRPCVLTRRIPVWRKQRETGFQHQSKGKKLFFDVCEIRRKKGLKLFLRLLFLLDFAISFLRRRKKRREKMWKGRESEFVFQTGFVEVQYICLLSAVLIELSLFSASLKWKEVKSSIFFFQF